MKDPREMSEYECRAEVRDRAGRVFGSGLDGANAAIDGADGGWDWTRTPTFFRAENNAGDVHDIYCPQTYSASEELWRLALIVWRSVTK